MIAGVGLGIDVKGMTYLMDNYQEDDLRLAFEELGKRNERRHILERINFMDDMLVAFGATQTKEGGREYRNVRRRLIDQYEALIGGSDAPVMLGQILDEPPRLGDILG